MSRHYAAVCKKCDRLYEQPRQVSEPQTVVVGYDTDGGLIWEKQTFLCPYCKADTTGNFAVPVYKDNLEERGDAMEHFDEEFLRGLGVGGTDERA